MLSFQYEGKPLELSKDFSITMNLKSPIFSEIGSHSYPFKIPNTPHNALAMKFRHREENTNDAYEIGNGVFLWNGQPIFNGTVKMRVFNSTMFEGNMMEGKGDFNFLRKNKTLQDVDFGEMTFGGETLRMDYINACANKDYPERAVSFPMIQNLTYFPVVPVDPQLAFFNYYYYSIMYYFTPDNNRTVIVPMLYLRYVIEKVFAYLGLPYEDSFFSSDPDYNKLVLFNLVDCNSIDANYFNYDRLKLFFNYHVPHMTINDFFSSLESYFNIRLFVNNTNGTVKIQSVDKIVKSPAYIEFSENIISISTETEEQITGFHLKMNIASDDEPLRIATEGQKLVLDHMMPPVQSISDLSPWPASQVFDIRWVYDIGNYYILNSSKTWQVVSTMYWTWNMFSEWIYKNKDQVIETKCSTLMQEQNHPYNAVVGNAMEAWKEVSPKLIFSVYQDNGYSDHHNVARGFTATNNLFYGGQTGLLNKHYKAFLDFRIASKLVKITKQMTFAELRNFDFSKKIMVNGTKYLVKSIQVPIRKDRISPAVLECYTAT